MTSSNRYLDVAMFRLNTHPLLVGDVIRSIEDVRVFMEYHVFAVWDFMCLIKALQHAIVPSTTIWVPQRHTDIGRFINQVVLDEETDVDPAGNPISHYQLYIAAMKEVGADTTKVDKFIEGLTTIGWHALPQLYRSIPPQSERFCRKTIEFIGTQQPHIIAAAFTYGRETVIPKMFANIVAQLESRNIAAPMFQHYLNRHIQIDGDQHGPIAIDMVNRLCGDDEDKHEQALETAYAAINNRIQLWSDIQSAIECSRPV